MRALDVALTDKGLTQGQAEELAGLSKGTLSLWMNGKRMPNARRYIEVLVALGVDVGAVVNDAHRRATEAGLLDGVTRIEDAPDQR